MHFACIIALLLSSAEALDFDKFYSYLNRNGKATDARCSAQRDAFINGVQNEEMWALQSKFPELLHMYKFKFGRIIANFFVYCKRRRLFSILIKAKSYNLLSLMVALYLFLIL